MAASAISRGFIIDTGGMRRMVSHSGTAGTRPAGLQDFHYPLHPGPFW